MSIAGEPIEVEQLTRLNEFGPDDLFICCASFEERCLSGISKTSNNFRTNYSVIFVIEEPMYQKQVTDNYYHLQAELTRKSSKGVFTISCQRESAVDGIAQLKEIWKQCKPRNPEEPFITIDISGFTKIYLLELLNYLVIELNLGIPRIIHTVQSYLPAKLTKGVAQITTIPNFFGSISLEKQTVLVLLLGFEPERSLAVWKHFNPVKTIALITNPPRDGNSDYLKYARENNEYLLSQSSVELRDIPPDSPYDVRRALEEVYSENRESYNMVIGPFGTKPQTIGVFLFYLEHPKVQVVYSVPMKYTRSYLQRKAGPTLLLPLSPMQTN